MARGFDTSTRISAAKAQQFADDGFAFAIRYLAPESWRSWKALTRAEAEAIIAAGLMIVSAWETTAGAAGEGAAAGREAGIFALQAAKEVGQPEGTKIYFCVDFEPMPHQYEAIADYFRAADAEIPGYEIDAYGNDKIIEYLRAQGIIRNGFQTRAWSGGRVAAGISIYQHDCGPNGLGFAHLGILIDADESYGNEGWWNTNMAIKQAPALPAVVANNVIDSYLSTHWNSCDAERQKAEQEGRNEDAEAWLILRDWQHTLANELRRASGQPEQ